MEADKEEQRAVERKREAAMNDLWKRLGLPPTKPVSKEITWR